MATPEYVDMSCKVCGHSPEAHHAGQGQCYRCDSEKRCTQFVAKNADATMVQLRDHPSKD